MSWAEVLLIHERGSRRKLLLSPATMRTAQHHDMEPNSSNRGRDLVTANNRGDIVAYDFTSELNIRKLKRGCLHPRVWPFLERSPFRDSC